MDATALARSLDELKLADGRVSLQELQTLLSRRGLHELSRAVGALAGRLTDGRSNINETTPWI